MEMNDVLRRAGAAAFALPRQFLDLVNQGSIENARQEVRGADRRRRIASTLEQESGPEESKPNIPG